MITQGQGQGCNINNEWLRAPVLPGFSVQMVILIADSTAILLL